MKKLLFLIVCCLLSAVTTAQLPPPQPDDSLRVSFVTCAPGPEIFELYGHEAVRVSGRLEGKPLDVVFNYGLFDFGAPGFVYRFVKGETDYNIGCTATPVFLYQYRERGSRVTERVLPLTQPQARQMLERLNRDTQPGYNTYRYKYFTANCATKPLDHLEAVSGGAFHPAKAQGGEVTRRELLRRYNEGYPWYQFGIDLVLGSMLDEPVDAHGLSFIPMELDHKYFGSLPETELESGRGDMREEATPFLLGPLFWSWVVLGAAGVFVVLKRRSRLVYTFWFTLTGLAGMLVWYLTFFSEHEGTSPNLLAWWLNPLWLAVAVMVWLPRVRRACDVLLLTGAVVTGALLAVWPLVQQHTDPAVYPLMLTTILLAAMRRY